MQTGPRAFLKTVLPILLLLPVLIGIYLLAREAGVTIVLSVVLAGAVLLAAAGWFAAVASSRRAADEIARSQAAVNSERSALEQVRTRLTESENRRAEDERRLDLVLNLNRSLVEARDESALMDAALSAVNDLVGGLGCSFVPVDEWEQPLPAFTFGQLPEPVLRAWATHLASAALRERCGSCDVLQSTPGGCPLHPQTIGNTLTVFCLPLRRSDASLRRLSTAANVEPPLRRTLGIMHLYLPAGRTLTEDTRVFLEGLLPEIALAIESVRMREQELTTLRQIQMLHAPEGGLADSLGALLDSLQTALDASFVILRLRSSTDERLSSLLVERGNLPPADSAPDGAVFERVVAGETVRSPAGAAPAWLALPMRLPEGQVPGMLLAGRTSNQPFYERQEAILHTVAAQAALLVENERLLRSLEYRAIIQERTRLAREIHDGLAQTLAYLKLQAAQMQSYLAQGDIARLSQILKDNYQALAEAYLDTRQAIDNLRLSPAQGLAAALEQIAAEFEASSGVHVECSIPPLPEGWNALMSPEIEAQLVRIVQEALVNVRKHARAQRAWVSVRERQDGLVLEVGDDGQGFDADDVPEMSRHGLRGMRERAEMIGADFQIVSQAHQGTLVRIALPAYFKEATS